MAARNRPSGVSWIGWGSDPGPVPDERYPRRRQVDVLTVRVDLKGSRPIVWRRLELRTDVLMSDVHRILQAAFGWYGEHLWVFGMGAGSPHDLEATAILCPYQVEEGDRGHDAAQVRLDEVLRSPGDVLTYLYDFGDSWHHVLKVEKVRAATDDDPPAKLVGGRRAGAPEDCGGVWGMADLIEAGELDPDAFDLAECAEDVAHALDDVDLLEAFALANEDVAGLPPLVVGLVVRMLEPVRTTALGLARTAGLDAVAPVVADAALLHRLSWFVRRVGDGVKLTAAGWLPPAVVSEAFEALAMAGEWIGAGNREDQTMPVLNLRKAAATLGLVKLSKGVLSSTRLGRQAVADPAAMTAAVVERFPLGQELTVQRDATVAVLLWLASSPSAGSLGLEDWLEAALAGVGWRLSDGSPIRAHHGLHEAMHAVTVLDVLTAGRFRDSIPSPGLAALARVILAREV